MKEEKNFSFFSIILVLLNIILVMGIGIGVAYMCNYMQENNITIGDGVKEIKVTVVNAAKTIVNADNTANIQLAPADIKDTKVTQIRKEKIVSDYYFYNQLTDNGKVIYNTIEGNLDKLKSGTYVIEFGTKFNEELQTEAGKAQMKIDFQAAWDALSLDNPQIFFIDVTKFFLTIETTSYGNKNVCTTYIGPEEGKNYLKEGIEANKIDEYEQLLEAIKVNVTQNVQGSDYDIAKSIHDALVEQLEYDQSLTRTNTQNIYGALVERCVVCEGYAKAYKYLLDAVGIPCILVSGVGTNSTGQSEEHIWNYVLIDNKWYAVDVTWDDPIVTGGFLTDKMKHRYFLKGSTEFNQNHKPSNYFSKNNFRFEYPKLNQANY